MTDAAYQECKKVMMKANHLRGKITKAKANVSKWTNIEDVFRREGQTTRADGARKMLLHAIHDLKKVQQEFADLKFPDNDLKPTVKQNTCKTCGEPISKNDSYCNEICEMVGTPVNKFDAWKNKSMRKLEN